MACGNNEVSGEALASQPTPLAHPTAMIQTPQIWTTKQNTADPDRLDVYVTTSGVFEPSSTPGRYDFRGTGHRELAKAIFETASRSDQPAAVRLGEKQYTHLVGRVERRGKTEFLVLNPRESNTGLIRGSGVAGAAVKGWNPSQDDAQPEE
jgi:hypothetical protein